MTPSQGLIDNMAPHIRVVFFVFIHGVFGAFFMIMIFLAAVLCPFFPESVLISIVSSVELLNGLVLDSLSFVWFSLSHQGSRRRIASLIFLFYFVFFCR